MNNIEGEKIELKKQTKNKTKKKKERDIKGSIKTKTREWGRSLAARKPAIFFFFWCVVVN